MSLVIITILSACSGSSTEEKIYDHLEESFTLEKDFEEQQEPIMALEEKQREIHDQMATLESNELDEVTDLSEQAIENINERKDLIALEKESLDLSREEFEETKDLIEKIEDQSIQRKAEEMYEIMMNRYEAYNQLHEVYLSSLEEETSLYTLLQTEDVEEEKVTDQISTLNKLYEQIIEENKEMNEATQSYNDLKKEFYEMIELNVSIDKD